MNNHVIAHRISHSDDKPNTRILESVLLLPELCTILIIKTFEDVHKTKFR
jgi:hypothetical protein